jgi:bacteriorhodopsin
MRAVCPPGPEENDAVSKSLRTPGDADSAWNARDTIYLLVAVVNLAPVCLYISTASIHTPAIEQADFLLWMISCALGTIFGMNLLSMVQLPPRSALDRFAVVSVPFVTGACTALEALRLFPRYAQPLNGRPVFVSRYTSWFLTVPMLIIQSGPLSGYPPSTFIWIAVLTNAYIVCGFSALLAPAIEQKWFWIFVTFATYSLTLHETARVLRNPAGKRTGYVWLLHGFFMVYGALYLLAATSTTSVLVEILGFGLCDIFTKGVFSTFMFNRHLEDLYKAGLLIGRFLQATSATAAQVKQEDYFVAIDEHPELSHPLEVREPRELHPSKLPGMSNDKGSTAQSGMPETILGAPDGGDRLSLDDDLDLEAASQDQGSGRDMKAYEHERYQNPLSQLECITENSFETSPAAEIPAAPVAVHIETEDV